MLGLAVDHSRWARRQVAKAFCFFFSKKKFFSSHGARQLDGNALDWNTNVKDMMAAIAGRDHVHDDPAACALHGEDIWTAGAGKVALVVAPENTAQLSEVMRAAHASGLTGAPRGAGASYTAGYVPATDGTISIDMRRMNRVIAVNPGDMVVTVEAGCTWASLFEVLQPQGLRTPFWGPMSGLASTVGGGLSQNNAMLGAGHYGTTAESVVGLSVVLADGRILRTGAVRPDTGRPFYRYYGPDLTGIFCGDGGVFGIKAEITLRLIRTPAHEQYASFAFQDGAAMMDAMAEIARAGVACETCGFDPVLAGQRTKRASLAQDVRTLGLVARRQKSRLAGIWQALRVVRAGRNFLSGGFTLHVIAEGRSAAGALADIDAARKIALRQGQEIENTVAKIIRAQPFPPLNSILGPGGERWVPIHGIVALSDAAGLLTALQRFFAVQGEAFAKHAIEVGYLFTTLSTNALIVEPVFYWPDERTAIHDATMEQAHAARLPRLPANPAARQAVVDARAGAVAIMGEFGCAHFQVGRTYPYRESRDPASWALLEAVKAELDPLASINPGVLGLTQVTK